METNNLRSILSLALGTAMVLGMCACSAGGSRTLDADQPAPGHEQTYDHPFGQDGGGDETLPPDYSSSEIDPDGLFTDRDLRQEADLDGAESISITDGQEIAITGEGVYLLSGKAREVTVRVEAGGDKVQLVLDGVEVKNSDKPFIYVKSADKVFVTSAPGSVNTLETTGFSSDAKADAVIYSKADLTLNGMGTVAITSGDNGVSCKDDLRLTGGAWSIVCSDCALEANDSIAICGGTVELSAQKDGIHAENDKDDSVGYISISGGTVGITASDDAVHAQTIAQIDGGGLKITAAEGIEATVVRINGGDVYIRAYDDGINAGRKSSAYPPLIEFTGGSTTVVALEDETDCVDSNGDIIVSGGVVDVTGRSTFDYDGNAYHTGGTVIVNGVERGELPG